MLRVLKVSSWTSKRRYLTKIKGRHMWSRVTQTFRSVYTGHDCGNRTFKVITSTLPLRELIIISRHSVASLLAATFYPENPNRYRTICGIWYQMMNKYSICISLVYNGYRARLESGRSCAWARSGQTKHYAYGICFFSA
jgi:hypothetical protein